MSARTESRSRLIRWMKFNAVGGIGILVQLATLTVLKSGFGLNYLVATAVAVEVTVLHNFIWHELYTWADRRAATPLLRLIKFNLSNGLISIAGNLVFMKFFVGTFKLNYFVANLMSIALCSILNFFASDLLVFVSPRAQFPTQGES